MNVTEATEELDDDGMAPELDSNEGEPLEAVFLPPEMVIPIISAITVSSVLSLIGSACVIAIGRRKLDRLLQRILFALSVADMMSSVSLLIGTYMLPSELDIPGASGNFGTCSTVGLLFIVGITCGAIYNAYLSLYFLSTVLWGWKPDNRYNTQGLPIPLWEIGIHAISFCGPFALALYGVIRGSIAPQEHVIMCFFQNWPWGCYDENTPDCERAPWEVNYRLSNIQGAIMGFSILFGIFCNILIYCTVRRKLKQTARRSGAPGNQTLQNHFSNPISRTSAHRNLSSSFARSHPFSMGGIPSLRNSTNGLFGNNQNNHQQGDNTNNDRDETSNIFNKRLKQVRTQSILYCLAFANTYIWISVLSVHNYQYTNQELQEKKSDPENYAMQFVVATCVPLQGFFNFLVFIRPRMHRWRAILPEESCFSILLRILKGEDHTTPSCGGCCKATGPTQHHHQPKLATTQELDPVSDCREFPIPIYNRPVRSSRLHSIQDDDVQKPGRLPATNDSFVVPSRQVIG